jgi:hypothetical protein
VEPSGASAPTHYSITASTCHSIAHRAPSQAQSHAFPFTYAGRRRGGAMMSGPLVNGSSQTTTPFQFPFIVLLRHDQGTIFNIQPSSSLPPSTSILALNFIPHRRQLQPSSPRQTLPKQQLQLEDNQQTKQQPLQQQECRQ